MKKIFFTTFFLLSLICSGHDDIGYQSSLGWSVDYGNNSSVDKTYPADYSGGVATFFRDYDGDGYIDLCKVDSNGSYLVWNWYKGDSNGNFNLSNPVSVTFGIAGSDQCVVGDFNGDKKADIAVARPSASTGLLEWYIDYAPFDGVPDISGSPFGLAGDKALSGDFNADGVSDVCVFRSSTSQWFVSLSDLSGVPVFAGPYAINGLYFGLSNDTPLVGDFNGDGYDDIAVYRGSTNRVLVNYFNREKPKMEGYGDIGNFGAIDQEIVSPVSGVSNLAIADFNHSRPSSLPLAGVADLGKAVNLRHGWTCIFDNSLDVDKWIQALQAVGINTLEYHPWMRAHEENYMIGSSWNTYVGDDRLWTSKAKMLEKIEKFRAIGGRSVCYNAIYASSPAFARSHPAWAIRDSNTGDLYQYGQNYLYLMGINQNINHNYDINGQTFKNFNDYLKNQAQLAEVEFNWDGWRWDWYGLPAVYNSDGFLPGQQGDISYEVSVLTDTLNTHVKKIRPDVTTTTLQLPYANNNIPFDMTAPIVDHQFLEIWPDQWATGEKYSQLYDVTYKAKSKYPDKPLFANFYPPTAKNLTTSWPKANIRYQFATCLTAGVYPAAQVVDGIAGFTDPVPFHAARYPDEVLTEISKWNRFTAAYGGYFYYSNPVYLIRDSRQSEVVAQGSSRGLVVRAKERIDKRTREINALIINLVDYGSNTELKWVDVNSEPAVSTANIRIKMPQGLTPEAAYFVTPDGRRRITLSQEGAYYTASITDLSLFGSLVVATNRNSELPAEPEDYARTFPNYEFKYDAAGETLYGNADKITVLDEVTLLPIDNYYNGKLSTFSVSSDANTGKMSLEVIPEKLYVTSTSESAIRVPIDVFKNFEIAIKGNNATAAWFGFRLLKPSDNSPLWEQKNIYYRIGSEHADNPVIVITEDGPGSNWKVYKRNIYNDLRNHPEFGSDWSNAIIMAVLLGPVEGQSAKYDTLVFSK